MARELPSAPRVYTTTYDNFKGVDFTNDSTNVWRRRSPSGTNMLPDESGRPFKRNGWEVMLSNADICSALGLATEDVPILKLAYFELAGKDHIAIFTEAGLIFYNGSVTFTCLDKDCYLSYDRCFFFEGNGTSAFYIYGNYRVWRYSWDEEYRFEEVTDKLTVPTVLISTSADGTGTLYDAYNMLGSDIYVQYHDCDLFTYWGSDGLIVSVDETTFNSVHQKNYTQAYTYNSTTNKWYDEGESEVNFGTLGITVSSQENGSVVFVANIKGIVLPNNVALTQYDDMEVKSSSVLQFDTDLDVITTGSPTTSQCLLIPDPTGRKDSRACLMFNSSMTVADLGQEDVIRVKLPSVAETSSNQSVSATLYNNATLIGEVV